MAQRSFKKLVANVDRAVKAMGAARSKRTEFIERFGGFHYFEASSSRRPINLINMAVTIWQRELAPFDPRIAVTSRVPSFAGYAQNLQIDVNDELANMRFGDAIWDAVQEALISLGVLKIGIGLGREYDAQGFFHDVGRVYCDCVTLDDYFYDITARRWDQLAFEGDDYCLPLEFVQISDIFDKEAKANLRAEDGYGEEGEDRADKISREGMNPESSDYMPMVRLRDCWCPYDNVMFTWPARNPGDKPLREIPYDGPECGPYHKLFFTKVPSQLAPLPMVANIADVDELINSVARKVKDDAENYKLVYGFTAGNADDARRVEQAEHRQFVRMDSPQNVREFETGGVKAELLALLIKFQEIGSYLGGNLNIVGGLGPQADTATQDSISSQAVSKQSKQMKLQTAAFVRNAARSVAWYLWTDPLRSRTLSKQIPGTDMYVPVEWSPETREGDMLDYDMQLDPFSLPSLTPQERAGMLKQLVMEVASALGPMMMQQGGMIDVHAFVRKMGQLLGVEPDVRDVIVWLNQQDQGQAPKGSPPQRMPSMPTKRTYERISTSRPNPQAREDEMFNTLMAGAEGSG